MATRKNIKLNESSFDKLTEMKNHLSTVSQDKTYDDLVDFLYDMYQVEVNKKSEIKKVTEEILKEKGTLDRNSKIKASDKLQLVWNAIVKYNIAQSKNESPAYIFVDMPLLHKLTGINKSRNIKPFLLENESEIMEHNNSLGIVKDSMIHEAFSKKEENGLPIAVKKVIIDSELGALFGLL